MLRFSIVVLFSSALFINPLIAQTPPDRIIIGYDIWEEGLEPGLTNVMPLENGVRGDISGSNAHNIWYKVYVTAMGDIDINLNYLEQDGYGYYLVLGPNASSDNNAFGFLPPEITFYSGES